MIAAITLVASLAVSSQPAPVDVAGPWTVQIGPGAFSAGGREINLSQPVTLDIRPPETLQARDECYAGLPVFNEKAGGWVKGARLRRVIAQECTGTGLVVPESIKIKSKPGDSEPFVPEADYAVDGFWGTVGRIESGAIAHRQTVFIDYDYRLSRIDTVIVDEAGNWRIVSGHPEVALARPPTTPEGATHVANIYVRGGSAALARENLFPLSDAQEGAVQPPVAEDLLPKTLAKLRNGEPVTIVAFGDSVTNGGGVDAPEQWYQNKFLARLQQRFPQAPIRMLTAAWGGASSKMYLEASRGGEHDFVRDVLEPKPDLVTIEFVNDAYLDEAGVAAHYAGILEQIRGVGAEVVLIAPHLVRPDWMGAADTLFAEDPRPYVKGLKLFAEANRIALADASARWCGLRSIGIPYQTLLGNDINHPDERGHEIFAESLIALFPAK